MNSKPLLLLSLALNLGLLGAVAFVMKNRPVPDASVASPSPAPVEAKTNLRKVTAATAGQRTITVRTNALDWRNVESGDYKEYIANLRSIGCPEETIRDIIIADVNKLFEDRKKALKKPAEKFKFWETGNKGMQKMLGGALDEEAVKQSQALAAEKRTLLKELLGVEIDEKPNMMAAFNPFEEMLSFLPTAKQTRLMEIMQQFQARQMKSLGNGQPDETDIKQMQKAQKEMEAEIAGMLTPREFDDYQLRLSQTAMMMRMQLDGFSPTEQEFREVFKLQKAFDDEFSPLGFNQDKEAQARRGAAQKELDDKLKATLGDQRFDEMQREKDYTYKAIAKVAEREGLPREAGVKVFDMKKVAEEQAGKVRLDKSLTPVQRTTALQAIRSETERGMSETLGKTGFDSYKNGNTAWWLNNLSPEQVPPTPKP